jgi:hypothetical protein
LLNNLEKKLKYLNTYLDRENTMARMFRQKEITLPLSQKDLQNLVDRLSCQLSPENLCCDGELPMREVRSRAKLYNGTYKDLVKYSEKTGLVLPQLDY